MSVTVGNPNRADRGWRGKDGGRAACKQERKSAGEQEGGPAAPESTTPLRAQAGTPLRLRLCILCGCWHECETPRPPEKELHCREPWSELEARPGQATPGAKPAQSEGPAQGQRHCSLRLEVLLSAHLSRAGVLHTADSGSVGNTHQHVPPTGPQISPLSLGVPGLVKL